MIKHTAEFRDLLDVKTYIKPTGMIKMVARQGHKVMIVIPIILLLQIINLDFIVAGYTIIIKITNLVGNLLVLV